MSNMDKRIPETQQDLTGNTGKSRKHYYKPQLVELGDLRTLTLGNSPTGYKDSGIGTRLERLHKYAPGFPTPDLSIPDVPIPGAPTPPEP